MLLNLFLLLFILLPSRKDASRKGHQLKIQQHQLFFKQWNFNVSKSLPPSNKPDASLSPPIPNQRHGSHLPSSVEHLKLGKTEQHPRKILLRTRKLSKDSEF